MKSGQLNYYIIQNNICSMLKIRDNIKKILIIFYSILLYIYDIYIFISMDPFYL